MIKKQDAIDVIDQYVANIKGCMYWETIEYASRQIKHRINDLPKEIDELTKLKVENMFLKKATDNYREVYSEDKTKTDSALIDASKIMFFLINHREGAFDGEANMAQAWIDKHITITDDPKNYKG